MAPAHYYEFRKYATRRGPTGDQRNTWFCAGEQFAVAQNDEGGCSECLEIPRDILKGDVDAFVPTF